MRQSPHFGWYHASHYSRYRVSQVHTYLSEVLPKFALRKFTGRSMATDTIILFEQTTLRYDESDCIDILHHFQQSFSYITMAYGIDREPIAHFVVLSL